MATDTKKNQQRVSIQVSGAVQGVGFRPFIFQLAKDLGLVGFVSNTSSGVVIEAQGPAEKIALFLKRIPQEKPAHSFIQNYQYVFLDSKDFTGFEIKESDLSQPKTAIVLPDIATCFQCLGEVLDSGNRRYLYPFTNCTHCGPRYSIIEALPYDRANTSMKKFTMCRACQKEYDDPNDRRFHAQPNACPDCGPHLELWNAKGEAIASRHDAVVQAVGALTAGKIVAVKGIGGFHLFADAHNAEAVNLLRARKHREEKPFAVMFPSLQSIEAQCDVSDEERMLLMSGESPIVLLSKRKDIAVVPSVAPGNPYLGAMLPYSPLHHIIMNAFGRALVATSANLSEEPICTDEQEAVERLFDIADVFLVHNRHIVRSIDDSVVRTMMNRPLVVRRARGYAPLPITIDDKGESVLATGGHLKNTVALTIGNNVFISQHIGDLQTEQSLTAFKRTTESLRMLYESAPVGIVCDEHPDYLSTKFAQAAKLPCIAVQHHHAHVVSCMAENHLRGTVLGIVWDGAGFGADGTMWGGEFLTADLTKYKRVGHFRTFPLPGGEKAAVEPRRVAAAILFDLASEGLKEFSDLACIKAFSAEELNVLEHMLNKKINTPVTSSVGRLFDAVASLGNLHQALAFEGQAAMALEYILEGVMIDDYYDFDILDQAQGVVVDWTNMFRQIIEDVRAQRASTIISAKFHNALVEMAVAVATRVGERRIVLSGGCFQNKYLTERLVLRLRRQGFEPYWHQLVPPNDGGISLGQAVSAVARLGKRKE